MKKLIRITTVPTSLKGLLEGQPRFMSSYYEVLGISSGGDDLYSVEEQEEIRIIPVEMTRKITPLKDLKALWQLYHIFKKERPFIVHSHTPKAGTLGMLAAWLARVPNRLHTIAGLPLLEATGIKRKVLNIVERITYACATRVYPNSHGLEQIVLLHEFAPPCKLKVLGNGSSNGINTYYFDPERVTEKTRKALKKSLGLDKSQYVFCFIGRLVRDKGITELVESFTNLYQEYPNTRLLLVGPYEKDLDPLSPETEYRIESMDSIMHVGWQDDVRSFLAISDCFVFPSYREGFPNVVMQAGAMGLFTIATDINGCNEIIIEEENGTLIPPKDAQSLYLKMKKQLLSPEKRNPTKYRQLIKDRFERRFIWEKLLEEYRELEG